MNNEELIQKIENLTKEQVTAMVLDTKAKSAPLGEGYLIAAGRLARINDIEEQLHQEQLKLELAQLNVKRLEAQLEKARSAE